MLMKLTPEVKFWIVFHFEIKTPLFGSEYPTFFAFKCKRIEFYDLYDLKAFEQGFLTLLCVPISLINGFPWHVHVVKKQLRNPV